MSVGLQLDKTTPLVYNVTIHKNGTGAENRVYSELVKYQPYHYLLVVRHSNHASPLRENQ
jgi:hypothetical protein